MLTYYIIHPSTHLPRCIYTHPPQPNPKIQLFSSHCTMDCGVSGLLFTTLAFWNSGMAASRSAASAAPLKLGLCVQVHPHPCPFTCASVSLKHTHTPNPHQHHTTYIRWYTGRGGAARSRFSSSSQMRCRTAHFHGARSTFRAPSVPVAALCVGDGWGRVGYIGVSACERFETVVKACVIAVTECVID